MFSEHWKLALYVFIFIYRHILPILHVSTGYTVCAEVSLQMGFRCEEWWPDFMYHPNCCCCCCCWTWFRWKLREGARVSALRKPVWSVCKMVVFTIFLCTNKGLFLLGLLLSTVMFLLVWGPEDPVGWFYSGWVIALILCVPGEVSPLFIIIFKWVSKILVLPLLSWERCCFQIRDLCCFSLNLRNKRQTGFIEWSGLFTFTLKAPILKMDSIKIIFRDNSCPWSSLIICLPHIFSNSLLRTGGC